MSRRKPEKQFNSGLSDGLKNFASAVSGTPAPAEAQSLPSSTARWFFLSHSAPPNELYGAFLEANSSQWVPAFSCYWSSLAARHRAMQLVGSIQGQEFVRFLTTVDLSAPLGQEVATFLSSEPWFAPLEQYATYLQMCVRYVAHLTTVGDLNAHAVFRDLECFIPDGDVVLSTAEAAANRFPVTPEFIAELQVWASNSLWRGHEAFLNPGILDTREGEVEVLRAVTQQQATSDSIRELTSNVRDRVAVCRGRTLERRARVSRAIFFAQATKRGLDHDRGHGR